jgi:hypothetical protein
MKNMSLSGDPVIDFIIGKDGRCWSLASSVAVTFVSCLLLAAAAAAGIVQGALAFGAIVVVVAVVSWWTSPASAVVVSLVGFFFADGFVFDQLGTLTWHGEGDVLRLALLVLLAVIASLLGHPQGRGGQPSPLSSGPARSGTHT